MEILSIHTCDCHFLAEEPLEQQFNVCSITKLQKSYARRESLKVWAMSFYDADCWILFWAGGQSLSPFLHPFSSPSSPSFFIHGIIVVLRKTVLLLAIVFNKHSLFTYIFIVLKHVYKYIQKEIHISEYLKHLKQYTFIGPVTTSTPNCGSALQKGISYFLSYYRHLVQ